MKHLTFLKTGLLAVALMVGSGSVWAETVTYEITAKNTLTTTGTAPSGSSATLVETYGTSKQMTSGNSQTVTLSGYSGYKITSITLSMRSNASAGSGNFIYKVDNGVDQTIISTNTFNNAAWYGAWSASYVNVTKAVDIICGNTSTVLKISATVNSLYCTSYSLTYEPIILDCEPSNLAFPSDESVIKSVTDASFIISANSLNETTDIEYSSSNLDVATVNIATGEVTIVGEGNTIITASQESGTYNSVEYCAGTDSYELIIEPLAAPVAVAANAISQSSFTANWEVITGAEEYELTVFTGTIALNEDFNGFTAGTPNSGANSSDVSTSLNTYTKVEGWTGDKIYQAGGTIKMGGSSALGYIVTPELDLLGVDYTLIFKAMAWSGDETDLKIYLDDTLIETVSELNNDASYTLKPYSVTITGGTATSKIKFEGKQASKSRFFLEDVKISDLQQISGSPFTVTGTSKDITGLTADTDYYYTVKAIAGSHVSDESNEIKVTTGPLTSLENATANFAIRVNNSKIMFNATAGELIEIYNIAGQKIISQIANDGLNTIPVTNKGVLVVKVGEIIAKVVN